MGSKQEAAGKILRVVGKHRLTEASIRDQLRVRLQVQECSYSYSYYDIPIPDAAQPSSFGVSLMQCNV